MTCLYWCISPLWNNFVRCKVEFHIHQHCWLSCLGWSSVMLTLNWVGCMNNIEFMMDQAWIYEHLSWAHFSNITLCHQTPYVYSCRCAGEDRWSYRCWGCSRVLVMTIILVGCLRRYPCSWNISELGCAHEQMIPWSHSPFEGGVVVVIDDRWLHFIDHLFTSVTLTSHPSTCAGRYMH